MTRTITGDSLKPVPWREFVTGVQLANLVLEKASESEAPRPYLKDPLSHPARAAMHGARGNPSVLIARILRDQFGADHPHLSAIVRRYWALMELLGSGSLDRWVIGAPGDGSAPRLHPALLLAAAEVKLTKNGKFPLRRMESRIEEIIRTEGGGEPELPDADATG